MMSYKRISLFALTIAAAGLGCWVGMGIQRASYADRCLDLGGGQNPGDHPICVVEKASAPLQLGPILITTQRLDGGEMRTDQAGQSLIELRLEPSLAAALGAFTEASVGRTLDIRVNGRLVRSVNIAEGFKGDRFILPLTEADAQALSQELMLDDL